MKKLVATAPRVAALVEYEDRAILSNEVKIRVRFGAPKHGTEVVDFRAASPFIDEDFNGEWQMFTPRPADAPRGIEFGKFQLGNMVVGDIIECGSDVTGAVATVVFPSGSGRAANYRSRSTRSVLRFELLRPFHCV